MIVLAFICFALAGGAKAHLVVTPGVSTFFLVGVWKEGRVGWKMLAAAFLVDLVMLLTYFGCEEWATAGRMSRSIFAAARECTVIHPSTWQNAGNFMLVLGWKCVGLILLLAAASLAAVSARAGEAHRLLTTAGAAVVGLVATLTVVQIFAVAPGISRLIVLGLVVTWHALRINCAVALRANLADLRDRSRPCRLSGSRAGPHGLSRQTKHGRLVQLCGPGGRLRRDSCRAGRRAGSATTAAGARRARSRAGGPRRAGFRSDRRSASLGTPACRKLLARQAVRASPADTPIALLCRPTGL